MSRGQGIPKVPHFRYVHPFFSRADLTSRTFASDTITVKQSTQRAQLQTLGTLLGGTISRGRMAAAVAKQPSIRRTCLRTAASSLR
jgi:hypothetical protein